MSKGKLYKEQASKVVAEKKYSLSEAIELLKAMPHSKFDETVEIAARLNVDTRQSDQNVRGAITLPHGSGKNVKVAVIADSEAGEAAKVAGADFVGFEELIDKIKGGWLDFDSLITTPSAMAKVRPLGRVLGPRGMMPNPKTGTVTDDLETAVKEAKAGKVEYRADRGGCAHAPIGKCSFDLTALEENCKAVVGAIMAARPAVVKGTYLLSLTICSTMSPGIKVSTKEFEKVK